MSNKIISKGKENDRGMAYCGFDCNRCPYEDCVGCKKEGKKLSFCEDGCKIRKDVIKKINLDNRE